MNEPLLPGNTQIALPPEVEALASAFGVDLVAANLFYRMGYLNGGLAMARIEHRVIDAAMRKTLQGDRHA